MSKVYLLESNIYNPYSDDYDTEIIGVFSTKELVKKSIIRYVKYRVDNSHLDVKKKDLYYKIPDDNFELDMYNNYLYYEEFWGIRKHIHVYEYEIDTVYRNNEMI